MEISFFGNKINLEIIILICVIYLILVAHTIGGCCNHGLMETFEAMTNQNPNKNKDNSKMKVEGFVGASTNNGNSSQYTLGNFSLTDTSSWFQQDLTNPSSKGSQAILNRPSQPIPLPEGEMVLFANTEFKPECCPNAYSTSTGCACMTQTQYSHLKQRGGNNIPYSEY